MEVSYLHSQHWVGLCNAYECKCPEQQLTASKEPLFSLTREFSLAQ